MAARPIEPIQVTSIIVTLNMKVVGKEFKADGKKIKDFVENLSDEDKTSLKGKFEESKSLVIDIGGKEVTLLENHITFVE